VRNICARDDLILISAVLYGRSRPLNLVVKSDFTALTPVSGIQPTVPEESYITISFLGEGKQVSGPHLQHTERRWSRCCRLAPYDFKFIQIDTRIRQTVKTNYGDGRRDVFRIFFSRPAGIPPNPGQPSAYILHQSDRQTPKDSFSFNTSTTFSFVLLL
jgi:hypothetical protein